MNELPIEIREHIASFLTHRHDLANLALTSSSWLGSTRRILYSTLTLRSDQPTIHLTLELLRKNDWLKKAVTSLNIITEPWWCRQVERTRIEQWLSVKGHIRGMNNLRRIRVYGIPRIPNSKRHRFFQDLFCACELNSLEEFCCTYMPVWTTEEAAAMVDIPIPQSIKKLIYHTELPSASQFFSSTFLPSPSANTKSFITALSLSLSRNPGLLSALESCRFQSLKTLTLTGFHTFCSSAFVSVISSHPSIVHLSISQSDHINGPAFRTDAQINIKPKDVLPNLLFLSANPRNIAQLSNICDRVRLLPSLTLDFNAEYHPLESIDSMFSNMPSGFPNLKHLSIAHLISGEKTRTIAEFMKDSAELEWWTGGFYCRDSVAVEMVSGALTATFPNLRRVDICELTISESSPPLGSGQVRTLEHLAQQNRNIQKIYLYMPHLNESREICAVYQVQRSRREELDSIAKDHGIRLYQTYKYETSGPYINDRRVLSYDPFHYTSMTSLPRWDDDDLLYDPWIHDVVEFYLEPHQNHPIQVDEDEDEDDDNDDTGGEPDDQSGEDGDDEDKDSGDDGSWRDGSTSAEGDSDN